jgi:DnaK suppressor protein
METAESETDSGLTTAELDELRERLERLRDDLRTRMGSERSVALESESLTEPMDQAEQTREQDDALLFTERDRTMLNEVERALAKFDSGTYGLSELSGSPIELRRLRAIPWARVTADEAESF